MRLAITSHAVDRWAQLEDPALSYSAAAAELRGAADTGRAEQVGTTRRGQAVLRVETPRRCYLVVKLGPDKLRKAYETGTAAGIVVTVLAPHMWERSTHEDEAREMQEAWADLLERKAEATTEAVTTLVRPLPELPTPHAKLGENHADWRSWAWTVGQIERDWRIVEHLRNEREAAIRTRVLVESAVLGLLTGRATLADLEAATEVAMPGRLAVLQGGAP